MDDEGSMPRGTAKLDLGSGKVRTELRAISWSVADAVCRAAPRQRPSGAQAEVGPPPREPRLAVAALRLPAARRAAPAPRCRSALLVAARPDVARLAFVATVRPARDRDSVASHRSWNWNSRKRVP